MAKANCQDDANYERKVDSRDRPYFIFKIGNDPIAKSEPYEGGKGAMENGIKSCKKNGPSELVVDKDLKEISTNEENVTTEEPDTSQTNNTYA
ncbi:MAG: hypothetical protein DRG78_01545 [Epsilonproteobacteria bacterium]|nr:MAG: hypothetical protein DRG78_01545 [Campylobacterota bacterium]